MMESMISSLTPTRAEVNDGKETRYSVMPMGDAFRRDLSRVNTVQVIQQIDSIIKNNEGF